jgi:hypothetical protein
MLELLILTPITTAGFGASLSGTYMYISIPVGLNPKSSTLVNLAVYPVRMKNESAAMLRAMDEANMTAKLVTGYRTQTIVGTPDI